MPRSAGALSGTATTTSMPVGGEPTVKATGWTVVSGAASVTSFASRASRDNGDTQDSVMNTATTHSLAWCIARRLPHRAAVRVSAVSDRIISGSGTVGLSFNRIITTDTVHDMLGG